MSENWQLVTPYKFFVFNIKWMGQQFSIWQDLFNLYDLWKCAICLWTQCVLVSPWNLVNFNLYSLCLLSIFVLCCEGFFSSSSKSLSFSCSSKSLLDSNIRKTYSENSDQIAMWMMCHCQFHFTIHLSCESFHKVSVVLLWNVWYHTVSHVLLIIIITRQS